AFFSPPENLGITVEYLNPSFLIKKPSGGHRLVTAFADVGRYSKPQPSLLPDVDSILRTIAKWKYIIVSDLTSAFYQIPLAKGSMKYCGVATPFRGVRVYTRSAMGMPGSETALEELMCRILSDCLEDGIAAKLADDLYCGADSPEELLINWKRILDALQKCNIKLSPSKTIICPRSTTILGWIWTQGCLSASTHRIATMSSCPPPDTVRGLRSFIGAYKVLGRVLPQCAHIIAPLESAIAGQQSCDKIKWSDTLSQQFKYQADIQHLAGSANVSSDFASRNAPECNEPKCQICNFISTTEDSVVRSTSVQDVHHLPRLPFTTRSAWIQIQSECPELRRTHAHLKQGTRPSKKLTNVKDVKRYLNSLSIAKDGLLVVRRTDPLSPSTELIVVPRSVLDGLVTALHIKLDHPSKHQLQPVMRRNFFTLDMPAAIARVSDTCHTCASLKKLPPQVVQHSTEEPPKVVGVSFAADVLKRCKQTIIVVRETTTSFTATSIIHDRTRKPTHFVKLE
ncbi:Hypothetical predicted protein, partial [Paramuricea clavata]